LLHVTDSAPDCKVVVDAFGISVDAKFAYLVMIMDRKETILFKNVDFKMIIFIHATKTIFAFATEEISLVFFWTNGVAYIIVSAFASKRNYEFLDVTTSNYNLRYTRTPYPAHQIVQKKYPDPSGCSCLSGLTTDSSIGRPRAKIT